MTLQPQKRSKLSKKRTESGRTGTDGGKAKEELRKRGMTKVDQLTADTRMSANATTETSYPRI
jgi:hypothetical protein